MTMNPCQDASVNLVAYARASSPAVTLLFDASPVASVGLSFVLLAAAVGLYTLAVWRDCKRCKLKLAEYLGFRALWLVCKLWHGVRPRGPDPLPQDRAILLVSNHTSPADPLFLQCGTMRVISFLMAKEYFDFKILRPIFRLNHTILVNRTGRDTAATKAALRALKEGRVVGVFPEGGIHLDPDTVGPAKPGAAMLALLTRVAVIPVFIDRRPHTNKLVQGLLRPVKTRVVFGPVIDLSPFYEREHDAAILQEVSQLLMNSIEKLRPKRAA